MMAAESIEIWENVSVTWFYEDICTKFGLKNAPWPYGDNYVTKNETQS